MFRFIKNVYNSVAGFINNLYVRYKAGHRLHEINQLRVKDSNKTLGELGGIQHTENFLLTGDLTVMGLLKFNKNLFETDSVIEIEINQVNANGIKALITSNIFSFADTLKNEKILESVETQIGVIKPLPQKSFLRNLIKVKNQQKQSDFANLPKDNHDVIYSFLDTQSLSNLNKTCTLFFNSTRNISDVKQNQMLNNKLTQLDAVLQPIETNLITVKGHVSYSPLRGGYMFSAKQFDGSIFNFESQLMKILPNLRKSFLNIFYEKHLAENRGVKIQESFVSKLQDVRNRLDKVCKNLVSEIDVSKVKNEADNAPNYKCYP